MATFFEVGMEVRELEASDVSVTNATVLFDSKNYVLELL